MTFTMVQYCGTKYGDCVVHGENVAVFGCAEKRDDDLDDVRKSWLASFWSPVDSSPLLRGEELLESSSDTYGGMMQFSPQTFS